MIIKKSRDRKDERTEERRERMIKRGNPEKGSKGGGLRQWASHSSGCTIHRKVRRGESRSPTLKMYLLVKVYFSIYLKQSNASKYSR